MKTSNIRLKVELDEQQIPEKLFWHADDGGSVGLEETKAFNLSIWDQNAKETLRIDLWAKDMPVHEMKRFYLDIIGGMAQSIKTATGDEVMASEMELLCDRLVAHLRQENERLGQQRP
jgi:gliding motility-associated protein GldC